MVSSRWFMRREGRCFDVYYTEALSRRTASPDRLTYSSSHNVGSKLTRDRGRLRLEAGGLLEHVSGAQQRLLVEGAADELEPERQAVSGESGGDRNSG